LRRTNECNVLESDFAVTLHLCERERGKRRSGRVASDFFFFFLTDDDEEEAEGKGAS